MSRSFLFFGTHILKGRLTPRLLAVFETGVQYQIFGALGKNETRECQMALRIGFCLLVRG